MEKKNELGTIKIADNAFEKLIKDAVALTDGKETMASGRNSIVIEESEMELKIEFNVIHQFGASMYFASQTVLSYLEENIRKLKLGKAVRITMRIVGIKTRKVTRQNIEFSVEF
ncbi:MAG: hypothetical protein IJT40_04725 [Firmicutes bacterium]|nr:hypothetical protein [Bacillota bacterium]